MTRARALVFGATGQIGAACSDALDAAGFATCRSGRAAADGIVGYDPFGATPESRVPPDGPFAAVVWAQGANCSDSVDSFDAERHLDIYRANVLFVAESLARLLAADGVSRGARLVVISSIWQTIGRPGKLSYMVSKAALQGLVTSAAIDLADRGILVNAVLPGVLDTPMTRANLTPAQIDTVAGQTGMGRLSTLADVANAVAFLASPANGSITGEFVRVDVGYSHAKAV